MNIDTIKVKITGVTPLLMCNGQLANPFNQFAKKMKRFSAKKTKTEEDLLNLLSIQWEGGLYWDEKMGLYFPSENIFASFHKAATKFKLGPKCSGISIPAPIGYPILTENSKNLSKLLLSANNRFDKMGTISKRKVLIRRPIFPEWSMSFDIEFETDTFNPDDIKTLLVYMGRSIGFGDWRPSSPKPGNFGKFQIDEIEWIESKSGNKKLIAA